MAQEPGGRGTRGAAGGAAGRAVWGQARLHAAPGHVRSRGAALTGGVGSQVDAALALDLEDGRKARLGLLHLVQLLHGAGAPRAAVPPAARRSSDAAPACRQTSRSGQVGWVARGGPAAASGGKAAPGASGWQGGRRRRCWAAGGETSPRAQTTSIAAPSNSVGSRRPGEAWGARFTAGGVPASRRPGGSAEWTRGSNAVHAGPRPPLRPTFTQTTSWRAACLVVGRACADRSGLQVEQN